MRELSIVELKKKMESGKMTARDIVQMYLTRIAGFDKQGPSINAVIELNPDAALIADNLDKERVNGEIRSPLHGIPVMLKDNINTSDNMKTTAGSLALNRSIAVEDSFVASKLRAAGCIILGKTNLSEWANFRSTSSVSGWSSRGGQTKNPYALNRNPCGSSSGSAVAAAANFCAAAIGTETDGSIICPAQTNSIVGIKPTVGLVGRSGIIPISHTQDTAGPMARTVADAAIILGALTGIDKKDPVTEESTGKSYTDYTQFLDKDGLKGVRIGVARNFFGFNGDVDRIIEQSIELMGNNGAEIIDPVQFRTIQRLQEPEFEVLLYEFKAGLNKYLQKLEPDVPVHSLTELIEYNIKNREVIMPFFSQEILIKAEAKDSLESRKYRKALKSCRRLSRIKGIDAVLHKRSLDAIIAPSGGPAWLTDPVNGDHYSGGSSSIAAVAGYPSITVPAGYICGLPVGISFFAGAYSEPILIKLAFAFESTAKIRKPPQFQPFCHDFETYR